MDLYTRELYTRKVGCIIYATGQEKEEAAESYPETEAVIHHWLSHRGSYLPLPIFLSLSLLEPLPLSVRPSCERSRYAPSRMPCHPGEKNNISLWNISNSMIATFIYTRPLGRVMACGSLRLLALRFFLFARLPYTRGHACTCTRGLLHRTEKRVAEQRPTAVFITRRETRRGGGCVKFAQTNRRWRRCRRFVDGRSRRHSTTASVTKYFN